MFAIERQNKIREKLFLEKRVDVVQLSELFSVTEVTIRRDLDKMEQEGFLTKTYGGAVLNEELPHAFPAVADSPTLPEKKMIGRIAAEMVEPGEAVFFSPGDIGLEAARHLKTKRATVITNDVSIASILKDAPSIKTIVTGGDMMPSSTALVGEFVAKTLSGIFINKAFIEVSGVHTKAGYTLDTREEAQVIQQVHSITNECIIVADYTRFDSMAFARLGDLTYAPKIITNKQVATEYKQYFFEHAVKIFTAYEFE